MKLNKNSYHFFLYQVNNMLIWGGACKPYKLISKIELDYEVTSM